MLIHRYSCNLCQREIPTDWLTKAPAATACLDIDDNGQQGLCLAAESHPHLAAIHICGRCWEGLRRIIVNISQQA